MGTVNASRLVQNSNLIAPIKPKQASENLSTTRIKDHICTFCIPCTCKFVRL